MMLVLRVCGVAWEDILNDYMTSCHTMQLWAKEGADLSPELQGDDVLSAEREYMQAAIDHINSKYGDVPQYLKACKVGADVQQRVRDNLLEHPGAALPALAQLPVE